LAGFVTALSHIDLDRPFVVFRLRWAAHRGAYVWARERSVAPVPDMDLVNDLDRQQPPPVMRAPAGHPDLLLAEAVADGVITAAAAAVIAATRLESRTLESVAAECGTSFQAVQQARDRAEHRLVAWLAERAAVLDPAHTSVVEAQVLQSAAIAQPSAADRSCGIVTGGTLKKGPLDGSTECGRDSASPAQPASVEVNRRCA
jgi:hypothetical protein